MEIKPQPMKDETIHRKIEKSIQKHSDAIYQINCKIFDNPELAWHEATAHDAICKYFDSLGSDYKVTRHAYGIETSFLIEATTQNACSASGEPPKSSSEGLRTVVFNAEYDALPNMVPESDIDPTKHKPGHACGHNLIASASIAGFIACWESLKETGKPGIVKLLGTPAEESGGGKIKLLEAGAYNNVDACLMVHPGPLASDDTLKSLAFTRTLASQRLVAELKGKASHAGFAPWDGKNALDAMMVSYAAISALRQQLKPDSRVAGIITHGGTAANVIPEYARAEYSVRAGSRKDLDELRVKILDCFKAGAQATGCTAEVDDTRAAYWDMISNPALCKQYADRMNEFSVKTVYTLPEITDNPGVSSDQGNVSHYCPAVQAVLFIQSRGAVNHQAKFVAAAGATDSFERALDCAKGLAAVGHDVLVDDEVAREVRETFRAGISAKAAAVARDFGRAAPSQEQIDSLVASPPSALRGLLKGPGIEREQAVAAMMAVDAYPGLLKGLFSSQK